MKRIAQRVAAATGALGVASLLVMGTAQAQDPVFFASGDFQCAIFDNGTVGCDLATPTRLDYDNMPFWLTVSDVVIDREWMPAHPAFDMGTPYTLPGGNPALSDVKTGDGPWGPYIEFAGARCESGFHGSFTCTSMNRGFSAAGGTIAA